jgi:hypothetical protein
VQGRGELAEERQFFLSARFFFLHCWRRSNSLFARLISHQPAVLFSQNKPVTSNQPASSTLLSEETSTSHQPTEQAVSQHTIQGTLTNL